MWQCYKNFCKDNKFATLAKLQFYKQLQTLYGFDKKIINGYEYFYRNSPLDEET